MTTKTEDVTGPDVTALRAAVEKADRLIEKNREAGALLVDLKRSLVLRLLHTQYPSLSITDEAKLLKGYGVQLPKK
jgi:hypothetical protein